MCAKVARRFYHKGKRIRPIPIESIRGPSTVRATTTTTTATPARKVADERDFQQAVATLLHSIQNHGTSRNHETRRSQQLLPPPLFPDPQETPMAAPEPPFDNESEADQLKLADDYWLKENTFQVAGQYSSYSELLITDEEQYDDGRKRGFFCRLPWNRQDQNARGETTCLVYNVKAFKSTEFGKTELLMLISKQMFLNGDCYKTNMYSTWIVARFIQKELITMLMSILHGRGKTPEELESDPCTANITYSEVVGWLKQNCPIRLRRLIKYQMAENSRTHPIYLLRPVEAHRARHDFLMEELQDNTPADVRIFRDMCPLLYKAMIEHVPYPTPPGAPRDPLNNLRFYTTKYDKKLEKEIDLHLHLCKKYLADNEKAIGNETRERMKNAQGVTMCSLTGRKNVYYAVMFHELLGKPPLETDLIYVLDFLARELIRELVIMALRVRRRYVDNTEEEPIEVLVYLEAINELKEETASDAILCGSPFQYPMPEGQALELPELPDKEVLTNLDKLIARAKRWDKNKEMEKVITNASKKGKAKETITLSADLIANIFSSEMLLRAHAAAMPPKSKPEETKEPAPQPKKRGKKKKAQG